jgi:hypothetical protein
MNGMERAAPEIAPIMERWSPTAVRRVRGKDVL